MRNTLIFIMLLLVLGCKDDTPKINLDDVGTGERVLVINEGNFQRGNASIGAFYPDSAIYSEKRFANVNGLPIGDVLNSIELINGKYWCVVNNSGVIHVVDSATLKLVHTISGFTSPRHAGEATESKVYVTDLFAGEITVVSSIDYSIIKKIPLSGWTEHLLLAGGRMWITNSDRPFIFLIDPSLDQVVDSLPIGNVANSMLRADNATILVLCEGKFGSSELAELYRIDPKARQVNGKGVFATGDKPGFLRQNPVSKEVYLVNKNLFILDNFTYKVKEKVLDLTGATYAFDISSTGKLYVGDAKDFVEKSSINVYSSASYLLEHTFNAGVNTNGFVFE